MLKLDIQMFADDGVIIIGTTVDTTEFYRKIREMERQDNISVEIDAELNDKELRKQIYEAYTELQKYEGKEILTQDELTKTQLLVDFIDKANERLTELTGKELRIKGVTESKEDINELINEIKRLDFSNMEKQIGTIGNSMQSIVRKAKQWIFAIIGVRGAYAGIRQAMSIITAQDQQLGADVAYMRNALAYTLEPIVRGIVNLMKQLMFYVAYIVKAWTGKNIFANANKSLKNATGSAKALNKELNKTIAGFDEMNVVSDTSSGGGSDAGIGGALPSFDLTNLEDMPIPSWLQWIVDNKDEVIATLAGITAGIIAINMGANGFLALGIGIVVYGIVKLIEDILTFIKDPSWENFANILEDLTVILLGVALAMLAVNLQNPISWILILIALITFITAEIIKHWEEIKTKLSEVGNWVYKHIVSPVENFILKLYEFRDKVLLVFTYITTKIKQKVEEIKKYLTDRFGSFGTMLGNIIGSTIYSVVNGILSLIEKTINSFFKAINLAIGLINNIPGVNVKPIKLVSLPRLARGGIVNNPGPGVMMGNYIAGEKGPEAVLPLTDEVLDRLGEAIARHQNINATIPVYVGNRQIARELRKINAEDDFAYNG